MTFVVMQVKWSVTLTDRLGAEILTVLERKGQVLHRVLLHVKVPGWSLNLNAWYSRHFLIFKNFVICLLFIDDFKHFFFGNFK